MGLLRITRLGQMRLVADPRRAPLPAETRVGIVQYWPDHDPVGKSIERYGEYLHRQAELIARIGVAAKTILEVGAGVGYHALCLATAAGSVAGSVPAARCALSAEGCTRVATPMSGRLFLSSESACALGFRTATARPFQTS